MRELLDGANDTDTQPDPVDSEFLNLPVSYHDSYEPDDTI
jgi:hypothetical protein